MPLMKNVEFRIRVAETLEETCLLVEAGFDCITTMEGAEIFRKHK